MGLAAIPNTNSRDIRKPEKHRVMSERLASEARKKMGAKGKQLIEQKFSVSDFVKQMFDLYEKLLKKREFNRSMTNTAKSLYD